MTEPLKIGDVLKDNDVRSFRSRLTVINMDSDSVWAKDTADRHVKISLRRIFLDGRVRRSGFTRISP